jgi:hypothetical protein
MTRGPEFSTKIRNLFGLPKRQTMAFSRPSLYPRVIHEFSLKIRLLPEGAS